MSGRERGGGALLGGEGTGSWDAGGELGDAPRIPRWQACFRGGGGGGDRGLGGEGEGGGRRSKNGPEESLFIPFWEGRGGGSSSFHVLKQATGRRRWLGVSEAPKKKFVYLKSTSNFRPC